MRLDARRRIAVRLVISLLIAAAAWTAWGRVLRTAFVPDWQRFPGVSEDFTLGVMKGNAQSTFVPSIDGWCLLPHRTGVLNYELPAPAGARINLDLWFYTPRGTHARLEASVDGGATYELLTEDRSLVAEWVLAPRVRNRNLLLRFSAANPTDRMILFVDKLIAGEASQVSVPVVAAAVFCICCVLLPWSPSRLWMTAALAIVATGAALRTEQLAPWAAMPLDPDAVGYREMAQRMRLFTSNGFYGGDWGQREPLFLLITRVFFRLVGDEPFKLRLMSTLLSIASIGVVMTAVCRFIGPLVALAAGLTMAWSEPLRHEAVRGLRLEAEIVLLVGYLILAFSTKLNEHRAHRAVLLGAYAGVMALLRTTYLPALCALNALSLATPFVSVRRWVAAVVLSVAVAVALVAPHRYSLYRHHGDPFFDTSQYARWNANMEFAGKPGYPTMQELQSNSYQGPRITYREYMFRLHSVREIVVGTLLGYGEILAHMDIAEHGRIVNIALQALALFGFLIAIRNSRLRWVPIAFVLLIWPATFLYHHRLLEPYRHTLAAFPLVLLAASLACERVVRYVWGAKRQSAVVAPGDSGHHHA